MRTRTVGIILLVVTLSLGVAGLVNGYINETNAQSHTWHQWGMSIEYPQGAAPIFSGLATKTADAKSGEVTWNTNGNASSLTLLWFPSTGYDYNYTAGFQAIYNGMQTAKQSPSIVGQVGNFTTMGPALWQCQTFKAVIQGQVEYLTYALSYYQPAHRIYGIAFMDTQPDTLNGVENYANTFSG